MRYQKSLMAAGLAASGIAVGAAAILRWRLSPRLRGVRYRLLRQHPSSDIDDLTLADRIRSTIGPVEKRLGSPRVKVMVHNKIAILHGVVPTARAAEEIVGAVSDVAGVEAV